MVIIVIGRILVRSATVSGAGSDVTAGGDNLSTSVQTKQSDTLFGEHKHSAREGLKLQRADAIINDTIGAVQI